MAVIKEDIAFLTEHGRIKQFVHNQLPLGYNNQFFKNYVLKEETSTPWGMQFFGLRTQTNTSVVALSIPAVSPLTKGERTHEERLCRLHTKYAQYIRTYNSLKPFNKPRLSFRVTDLTLYSPEHYTVFVFQTGLFQTNTLMQTRFYHFEA